MNDEPQKSWIRNYWWVFPAGCLGIILLGVGLVACGVFFLFHMLKDNEAYEKGLAMAVHHPAVIAALGEPIEPGSFVSGKMNWENSDATASLSVPLSGPKGSAVLRIEAAKKRGSWNFSTVDVDLDGVKTTIHVLPDDTPPTREPENEAPSDKPAPLTI